MSEEWRRRRTWQTLTAEVEASGISRDTLRILFGVDPAKDAARAAMAVSLSYLDCPVAKPVKRRGLTGKRYRIARRRYAREMRAYRRGLILPVERALYLPRVVPVVGQEGFGGARMQFMVYDEADGEPWYGADL